MSTNGATSLDRTHPCLRGDPMPTSAQQPSICADVRFFTVDNLVSEYPYHISLAPGKLAHVQNYHIPYYEISGLGPPPADISGTNPGDVWVDLSPEQHAVYAKIADGSWKRWYDPQPSHKTEETIVKHPQFPSRLLWCSDAKGISWYVKTTVCSNQERAKGRGLVSRDAGKTEEAMWREASVLIRASLDSREAKAAPPAQRLTSPLSPPLDSREPSPVLVLGKRKTRAGDTSSEQYKGLLRDSILRLEAEKEDLMADILLLNAHLDLHSQPEIDVADREVFSKWAETVIGVGIETQSRTTRDKMELSVREYWILMAELAADEAEYAKEEGMLEDAQIGLGLAISEHKELKRKDAVAQFAEADNCTELEMAFRV
ncbi:hypothetical protein C8R44DRAFT_783550 [Mycena epipterygia]|nr:hypothetical protein C8R44DRAFT_783550 [Mycena epipterygia]